MADQGYEQKKGGAGKFVFLALLLLVAGVGYLGYTLMGGGGDPPREQDPTAPAQDGGGDASAQSSTPTSGTGGKRVSFTIAYGTEKKDWLKWAAEQFEQSPAGRGIEVKLEGMGSLESMREILKGTEIHVWSPASSVVRKKFESDWKMKHGSSRPILNADRREPQLVLTPMVFVMWKDRYEAFRGKYEPPTFTNMYEAMHAKGGWDDIAGKPDWGFFKFAHTNPNESNSGLMTAVLMAYDYHGKSNGLERADIVNAKFQTWFEAFEKKLYRPSGELEHSTGTMFRDMIMKGEGGAYDAVMVYENLAMAHLDDAAGRGSGLVVAYPERNVWNDHPYYILDAKWSSSEQRAAAKAFYEFLQSEPVQRKALIEYGFRPVHLGVPLNDPESPFTRHKDAGVKMQITNLCEPPEAGVLTAILNAVSRL